MTGSDSTLSLAGDDSCDGTYPDIAQLLGKVRREKTCQNPAGEEKPPNDSGQSDPFDFGLFSEGESLKIFPKFVAICPTIIFGPSNIPVCKDISNGDVIRVAEILPVTLLNVEPSTPLVSLWCTNLVARPLIKPAQRSRANWHAYLVPKCGVVMKLLLPYGSNVQRCHLLQKEILT